MLQSGSRAPRMSSVQVKIDDGPEWNRASLPTPILAMRTGWAPRLPMRPNPLQVGLHDKDRRAPSRGRIHPNARASRPSRS